MFGTLKPAGCGLLPADREAFRRLYCGLCKGLGTHISLASRVLVHHDVVLYAAAADALQAAGAAHDRCRCPVAPHQFRPILEPNAPAIRAATGIQVLLADQWVADQQTDGRWFAWLLRPALSRPARLATRLLDQLGLDAALFTDLHRRQLAVEQDPNVTPAQAAEPSAELLASLFRQIPNLPGSVDLAHSHQPALSELGAALGRAIYAVDALEDLAKDQRRGDFNPCLRDSAIDPARLCACLDLLTGALADLRRSLIFIPWQRHESLLRRILLEDLPRTARRAMAAAQTVCVAAGLDLNAAFAQVDQQLDDQAEDEQKKKKKQQSGCCGDNCGCCDCSCLADDCCRCGSSGGEGCGLCACFACCEGCDCSA